MQAPCNYNYALESVEQWAAQVVKKSGSQRSRGIMTQILKDLLTLAKTKRLHTIKIVELTSSVY